jgi:nickel-dependent lactate racemase
MSARWYVYVGPNKKHYFTLPSKWIVDRFLEDSDGCDRHSATQMIVDALATPVGCGPLEGMVDKSRRIAVIVDDGTRPTPVREILEVLLPKLVQNGAPADNISIVVACGTHVAMEKAALEARIGSQVLASYNVVQHSAWQDDLVPVPIPGAGRTVRVNPVVAGADLKIGLSSILPHPMAGYGGGPKILMPGVCDIGSIMSHHMKNAVHPKSRAGTTEGNPFYEECMRTAEAIGLDFSINCVYDQQSRLARTIAGSLRGAFGEAVDACFRELGVTIHDKVDVTIASAHPHSHGIQFYKGLGGPDEITKARGAILIVAPSTAPIPGTFIDAFKKVTEKSGGNPSAYVTGIMSQGKPFLPEESAEFNMAMSCAMRRPSIRTLVTSPMIAPETASTLGLEYAATFEEGLSKLARDYPEARVAIFPSGGLVVPIVDWER